MAKDWYTGTINPNDPDGQKISVTIPVQVIENYYTFHPVRFENLRCAKHVLERPLRIFAGIRQWNEGGWCFTGRPESWNIRENIVAPFPGNLVYAVYLNERFYVFECRAELSASDDPNSPCDWQDRYKGLIWKSTS
jgi:hypothetical protein